MRNVLLNEEEILTSGPTVYLRDYSGIQDLEVQTIETGHVILKSHASDKTLNIRDDVFGGFLLEEADAIAGMVCYTLNKISLTLNAQMNFIKPISKGSNYLIDGTTLHSGRTTQVVQIKFLSVDAQKLFAQATFTMFTQKVIAEKDGKRCISDPQK